MSVVCNKKPVISNSYVYSPIIWHQKNVDNYYSSQITAPPVASEVNVGGVGFQMRTTTKDDFLDDMSNNGNTKPLREKNGMKPVGCKHVPHREKPPQAVARRNARERKRVQAVNNAFLRLRKVVPIQNVRGKRISKVKTLQYAIKYIHDLREILQEDNGGPVYELPKYCTSYKSEDLFDDLDQFEDDFKHNYCDEFN